MASSVERPTAMHAARKPGRRRRLPVRRRAAGLPGTIGVTTLGALLPGSGYLWTGRKALGWAVLNTFLLVVALVVWYLPHDLPAALDFAVDRSRLHLVAAALGFAFVAWALVVLTTYTMVRPLQSRPWQRGLSMLFVAALTIGVAAPVAMATRYAMVTSDVVATVFQDNETATVPDDVSEEDPWGGRDRVNVLLLGGDGNVHRDGVRTDSMILASIDTQTGKTVLFSLPRNLMYAQFPEDSPLHDIYPDGFTGEGDDGEWMLNAVYRNIPTLHPGVLGESDNEGADALKQAIAGSTGTRVDYYLLVNLAGFQEIVDAMGGVTVNINEPVAIGGITDLGVEPDDWLQPGPAQHLDGFEALWFSRGRYGSDDYERMERQRCMIDAIVDKADPFNLIRRYQKLADIGKEIVRTDIPSELLPAFIDLAMEMKERRIKSVVFRSSDEFSPGDPDFTWMQSVVDKALDPPKKKPGANAGEAADAKDACAYDPGP
ncbi:MAG: LCP family protein [Nocardioidaceae bacterium]